MAVNDSCPMAPVGEVVILLLFSRFAAQVSKTDLKICGDAFGWENKKQ